MDVPREIVLEAGTNLITITFGNDIQNPTNMIFHLTFAEALVTWMDMSERLRVPPGSRYLQTFQLTQSVVIKPSQKDPNDTSLDDDSDQLTLENYIRNRCQDLGGDGFAESMIIRGNATYIPTGRILGYVICAPDILIHVQSFKFDPQTIKMLMTLIITEFMADEHVQEREFSPNIAVILNGLTVRIKNNRDAYFTSMFVQPAVEGYATANIIPILEQASMTRLPASPPQAAMSPKNPASPIENFDAFAIVANDVLRIIAMNMRLEDLLATCQTSIRFRNEICNDERFWAAKVIAEFPGREKPRQYSWKQYYRDLIGRVIDGIASIFNFLNEQERMIIANLPTFERIRIINQYRQEAGLAPLPIGQIPLRGIGVFDFIQQAMPARAGDEAPWQPGRNPPADVRPARNPLAADFDGDPVRMMAQEPARQPGRNPLAGNFDFDGDPVERLEQRPALWRRQGLRQMDGPDAMRRMQQEPARGAQFMPAPVFPPPPNNRGNQVAAAEGQLREFARAYANDPNPLRPEDFEVLARMEETPETIRILGRLEDYRDQFEFLGFLPRISILNVVFGDRDFDDPALERQLLAIWRFWERLVDEGVIGNQMPPLEDDIDENQLAWNRYVMNPNNPVVAGDELLHVAGRNPQNQEPIFRRLMDYAEMFELPFDVIMQGVYQRIARGIPNHHILLNDAGVQAHRNFILQHHDRIMLLYPEYLAQVERANQADIVPQGNRPAPNITYDDLVDAYDEPNARNRILEAMNGAIYGMSVRNFMLDVYDAIEIREPEAIDALTPDMRDELIEMMTRRYAEHEAIRIAGVRDRRRRDNILQGQPQLDQLMAIIEARPEADQILERLARRVRRNPNQDFAMQHIFDLVDVDPIAQRDLTIDMRIEIRNRILNRIEMRRPPN